MKKFTYILREINNKLDLPQPSKSRIILEIAADMEGLYEHYLRSGLKDDEAIEKVKEKFDFSREALSQLVCVHESFIQKILNKLPEQARTQWERIILLVLFFCLLLSCSYVFIMTPFVRSASLLVWPVLGIGLYTIYLSFLNMNKLNNRKKINFIKIHSGLSKIVSLGGLLIFISLWGYFFEYYKSGPIIPSTSMFSLLFMRGNNLENNGMTIANCFVKSSSIMIVGLFILFIIIILLYTMINKLQKIEYDEAMLYLEQN
jgi:hypothetical protein